jgi:methyl-accepting chemotaxis protein
MPIFPSYHDFIRLEAKVDEALRRLHTINQRTIEMSAEIDRITASVTNLTTVDDSLVALVTNLAQTIRDNADNPAALNALADKLDAEKQKVSDAVTANTPSA